MPEGMKIVGILIKDEPLQLQQPLAEELEIFLCYILVFRLWRFYLVKYIGCQGRAGAQYSQQRVIQFIERLGVLVAAEWFPEAFCLLEYEAVGQKNLGA